MEGLTNKQLIKYYTYVEPNPDKVLYYKSLSKTIKTKKTPMEKFIENVDKRGLVRSDMSPCWRWIGRSIGSHGYGQISIDNVRWNAHRLSYYLHNNCEDIPDGKYICHKCDNKECCNPEHLYCGTPNDNIKDTIDRGQRKPARVKEKKFGHTKGRLFTKEEATGENNIKAILNWEKVREIRKVYNESVSKYGVVKKLSEQFGMATITISKIVANKLWTIIDG